MCVCVILIKRGRASSVKAAAAAANRKDQYTFHEAGHSQTCLRLLLLLPNKSAVHVIAIHYNQHSVGGHPFVFCFAFM